MLLLYGYSLFLSPLVRVCLDENTYNALHNNENLGPNTRRLIKSFENKVLKPYILN